MPATTQALGTGPAIHGEDGSTAASGGAERGAERLESAMVGSVVRDAQSESSGEALDAGVREEMEQKFGTDFGDVRVYSDGAAADAAGQLNANAFTVDKKMYFAAGKYDPKSKGGKQLIAHELTHVAQQDAGAAKDTNAGPTVSRPGDAAEVNAEQASNAAVNDEKLPAIGTTTAAVHFDRMGDLRSAADGNFLGMTSGTEILTRVRALQPEERRLLERDQNEALVRKIVRALDRQEMTTYFTLVAYDLRWKLYWLNQGGHVDSLSEAQWRWVIGYAGPAEMASLRTAFPAGYRMFMEHAPAELIPPFDKLEGLVTGAWRGDAGAIRTAVASLHPTQKEVVKYRADMMSAIMRSTGNAEEKFRTVTYLGFQLHQAVYWINQGGIISQLTRPQWGQLLAEAPKFQFDALVAAADLWALVQTHCDPALIQVVRGQTNDPTQIGRSLDDQVQADALFASLGAAGFLGLVTQVDVAANYGKCKARGKVTPVLDGLPKGN
ncbi:MAG TPA: DUF4157 domain-containing protein, partial [Kofleriaceae bacterium]